MYGFTAHSETMTTLFDKFGGVRPMANHLDDAPSTIQSWKSAGRVPSTHQPRVLAKAEELGLDVSAEDIIFPLGRGNVDHDAEDGVGSCVSSPGNLSSLSEQVSA